MLKLFSLPSRGSLSASMILHNLLAQAVVPLYRHTFNIVGAITWTAELLGAKVLVRVPSVTYTIRYV